MIVHSKKARGVLEWVALVKAKEAQRCAGIFVSEFGPWRVTWTVSRVDKPERYGLAARLIAPEKGSTIEGWETLGRITEAFGAPLDPAGGFPEDPAAPIYWAWSAPAVDR